MIKKIKYEEYEKYGKFIGGRMSGKSVLDDELSPLQALEDLREDAENHLTEHTQYLNKRLDIIETALKNIKEYEDYKYPQYLRDKKKLKALETIKEKDVDIGYLTLCKKLEQYNDRFYEEKPRFYVGRQLTQSEFDLLKEVLL